MWLSCDVALSNGHAAPHPRWAKGNVKAVKSTAHSVDTANDAFLSATARVQRLDGVPALPARSYAPKAKLLRLCGFKQGAGKRSVAVKSTEKELLLRPSHNGPAPSALLKCLLNSLSSQGPSRAKRARLLKQRLALERRPFLLPGRGNRRTSNETRKS
jgi:hypothetical protein